MKKTFGLLALMTFYSITSSLAQTEEFELGEKVPIQFNYYGNLLVHPGFSLGVDWNLLQVDKLVTKDKSGKSKTIRKVYGLNPTLSFYNHTQSHSALITSIDVFRRRYSKRLFFRQISLGLSYERRFNNNETFEVSEEGNVTNIGTSSRGYLGSNFSISGGKRFMLAGSTPLEAFAGLQARLNFGYAAGVSPAVNFIIGVRLFPNWGITRGTVATKLKQKKR